MAAQRRPNPSRVIDAAMRLAAERRWRDVSMRDIATAAGVSLGDLHGLFRSKGAILAAFIDGIDAKVIADTDTEALSEPARDRLFDVLVRRFEALRPHRVALGSILRDTVLAPEAGLAAGCRLMRSMSWSLEAAGIGVSGPLGRLKVRGLATIYVTAFLVFLRDDGPGLARTMARLDRALGRSEAMMLRLCPFAGGRASAGPQV